MISSTARDLPKHRQKVMDACMRLSMFYPDMMEHLTATDANAFEVSLRIVDRADIYVGIFGFRYGYVPGGQDISVTEAEYNRAVERGIPRLIFLMSDNHDIKPSDFEGGDGAAKLTALKERLKRERVVGFFDNPDDLKAQVIQSLVPYRERDVTTFHYIADIPQAPEVYIAHPYTLLQTHNLIGRQKELTLLTDWITGKELKLDGQKAPADSVRIMSVVAIGGMGKSALTWKWFNDVAPQEMKNLAGRMWWSFYESDATFENFVIRALAYVSRQTIDEVMQIPAPKRETQLLAALDHQPVLLVLDGLERILIAYARMDAARLDDSEVGKEKSLRKTADPRVGSFLKKLAQVKASRVLVSSRLYPTEVETVGGDAIPGTFKIDIEGLTDEDAIDLWRAFEVRGSRDELLPIFNTFAKHPLLIQALAGEVKRYRKAPGDFEAWRKANPRFDPSKFSGTKEAMAHVLEFALRGLGEKPRRVLHTISAFRMPATYDTLTALLVGRAKARYELSTNKLITEEGKLYAEEKELDAALTELEDRGLIGWDKRANRYDLHPIVRNVVWSNLRHGMRQQLHTTLCQHFETLPVVPQAQIESLNDLTPAIEFYNALMGVGRHDDALEFFRARFGQALLYRINASRQVIELLEMLFPKGAVAKGVIADPLRNWFALDVLAKGYGLVGLPGKAADLRELVVQGLEANPNNLIIALGNYSNSLAQIGKLRDSETAINRALAMARANQDVLQEAITLTSLGIVTTSRKLGLNARLPLQRAIRIFRSQNTAGFESVASSFLSQSSSWHEDFALARSLAERAWQLSSVQRIERDFIRAARVQGEAALGLGNLANADERLHHAFTRARNVNLVEEELPALTALAALRRRQADARAARDYLDDVWEYAERGPYPLFHADAFNVLAQIERDEGNNDVAIEAATKAYRLAWCDGPPFAYHWGLEKAKRHLKELGAPEPEMPRFDESKFEPMPEVEINPHDDFYVDEESIS
jgi:tetratricopeptide (TPR) repeat protein